MLALFALSNIRANIEVKPRIESEETIQLPKLISILEYSFVGQNCSIRKAYN